MLCEQVQTEFNHLASFIHMMFFFLAVAPILLINQVSEELYLFWPVTYKSTKQLPNCIDENRDKRRSNRLQCYPLSRPHLYCYCFLLSLYMNQVPEKLYFGQWSYGI
jgi:hypothetical protein